MMSNDFGLRAVFTSALEQVSTEVDKKYLTKDVIALALKKTKDEYAKTKNVDRVKKIALDTLRLLAESESYRSGDEEVVQPVASENLVDIAQDTVSRDAILQQISDLREGVVRFSFIKADGSVRVMWGTLNQSLIKKYCTQSLTRGYSAVMSEIVPVEVQIEKDYVKVLDLEAKEFRTYKPSRLITDGIDGIPYWLKVDSDNDAWFNIVFEGHDLADYLENGHLKRTENYLARGKAELFASLTSVMNGVEVDTGTERLIEEIRNEYFNRMNQFLSRLAGMEVPLEVRGMIESGTFKKELNKFLKQLRVQFPLIPISSKDGQDGVVYVQAGSDLIVCHPYFIFNSRTGNVYYDRLRVFTGLAVQQRQKIRRYTNRVDKQLVRPFGDLVASLRLPFLKPPRKKRVQKDEGYEKRWNRMVELAQSEVVPVLEGHAIGVMIHSVGGDEYLALNVSNGLLILVRPDRLIVTGTSGQSVTLVNGIEHGKGYRTTFTASLSKLRGISTLTDEEKFFVALLVESYMFKCLLDLRMVSIPSNF